MAFNLSKLSVFFVFCLSIAQLSLIESLQLRPVSLVSALTGEKLGDVPPETNKKISQKLDALRSNSHRCIDSRSSCSILAKTLESEIYEAFVSAAGPCTENGYYRFLFGSLMIGPDIVTELSERDERFIDFLIKCNNNRFSFGTDPPLEIQAVVASLNNFRQWFFNDEVASYKGLQRDIIGKMGTIFLQSGPFNSSLIFHRSPSLSRNCELSNI